ncbi:MAG: toll/interleukin-1 receptor domain-containing protein, partial [candidate division NC10 bacterium]
MEEEGREAPGNRQVFISYARGDAAEWAVKLARVLREHGFQPWLDTERGVEKSGIPIGTDFDIRLEMGIEGSQLLVALLSPSSLRQESFCRNELLFALSQKVPIVPVRVAEVTPPIQIIALNYLDALQDPEKVLAELPQILERVLREGRYGEREWPSPEERKGGAWWSSLRRLDFGEELGRYGGDFVGREWLFREVGGWIARSESRVLLLTAEAGFGKSALAAQLTARWNVRGVHFCSRSQAESCRPEAWLKGLIEQLARQYEPYREALRKIPEPDWNARGESLFRTLVADPLRACQGDLPVDEPWVLVVDGLDEALAETGMSNSLAELLADAAKPERGSWPDWLRLVATARPDDRLLPLFRGRCESIALHAGGKENQEDLRLFLGREVRALQARGSLVEGKAAGESVIGEIHRLAAGNFLYAEQVLKALADPLESNRLRVEELGKLPPGLGGLYHEMFRKRFGEMKVYEEQALPLLECLVAAREALPESLLLEASGLEEGIARRSLRLLSQFLR